MAEKTGGEFTAEMQYRRGLAVNRLLYQAAFFL
jgi:hypothetical protein